MEVDFVQRAAHALHCPPREVFLLAAERQRLKQTEYIADVRFEDYHSNGLTVVPAYVKQFCWQAIAAAA